MIDYKQLSLFDDDDDYVEIGDESGEQEVYFDPNSFMYLTEEPDEVIDGLYVYRCYDEDDTLFSTWKHRTSVIDMPLSQFKGTSVFSIFKRECDNYRKDKAYRYNSSSRSTSIPSDSKVTYTPYKYPTHNWYISEEEALEKYCKSNTLCLHKSDPTTTMLKQIYEGKGWDVINDCYSIDSNTLAKLIDKHERIVMLGHGSGYGLIGFIRPEHAPHLEPKKLFALWCNADAYCERYLPNKKGFFACGNMPSDEHEARAVGYNVSHNYMDDNITYWCKLCGDVVEKCLEGNAKEGCKYIRDKYWEKYGHSDNPEEVGITTYNYQRTKTAGEKLIPAPTSAIDNDIEK